MWRNNTQKDFVRIRNLQLLVSVGDGAQWPSSSGEPKLQPVFVDVAIPHDLRNAAFADDIEQSINYGALSRSLLHCVESISFSSLEALLDAIFSAAFADFDVVQEVEIALTKPRASPYVQSVSITSCRRRRGERIGSDCFSLTGLECTLIVGLNPCEREDKQQVRFDVFIARESNPTHIFGFRALGKSLREAAEDTSFISLESLASLVAERAMAYVGSNGSSVTVRANKPKALVFAEAAQVEVTRSSHDFTSQLNGPQLFPSSTSPGPLGLERLLACSSSSDIRAKTGWKIVAIAIGSNLGDTFANIEASLQLLEDSAFVSSSTEGRIEIIDTSFLYETAPMYVLEQPKFVNGAVLVRTNIEATALLVVLKSIEVAVGRIPSARNGPRAIDLDILFFDNDVIDTRAEKDQASLDNLEGHVVVPHPRMIEREFVLRPLNDMIPNYVHPILKQTVRELLACVLNSSSVDAPAMVQVVPFPTTIPATAPVAACPSVRPTASYWPFPVLHNSQSRTERVSPRGKTRIMATLNTTPDSFSDGATHDTVPAALSYTSRSLAGGADIVDIGGYSTRPGAAFVSPDEEISRVIPVIEAIRASSSSEVRSVLISVDTFRSDVAQAALAAGANCINDVYAFTGPDYPLTEDSAKSFYAMRAVARKHAVPVIVMHSRGPAGKNQDYSAYYTTTDGVAEELGEKVKAMIRGPGGLRRWQIIVDPGIGFSKTVAGNLDLIRSAENLTTDVLSNGVANPLRGFPQLIGASRKSFLGKILKEPGTKNAYAGRETEPRERGWATAAVVAAAVQQGVRIVRVHDVLELGDVVRIADSLWR